MYPFCDVVVVVVAFCGSHISFFYVHMPAFVDLVLCRVIRYLRFAFCCTCTYVYLFTAPFTWLVTFYFPARAHHRAPFTFLPPCLTLPCTTHTRYIQLPFAVGLLYWLSGSYFPTAVLCCSAHTFTTFARAAHLPRTHTHAHIPVYFTTLSRTPYRFYALPSHLRYHSSCHIIPTHT